MKTRYFRILCLFVLTTVFLCGCGAPNAPIPQLPDNPAEPAADTAEQLRESDYSELFSTQEEQNKQISFLCAGDNVIHPSLYIEAGRRATATSRKYNFLPMYSDVAQLIASYDIAFINQETLMAGDDKYGLSGYPMFNSPQDLGMELADLGFDIVNIANNHMLDQGSAGLADTIAFYDTLPYMMIGGYKNQTDYDTVRVYEEQGVKIAMLSYTYSDKKDDGTYNNSINGLKLPSGSELVIPLLNDDAVVERQIKAARDQADLVFVSVHWGTENMTTPNEEQKHYAAVMAAAGADVIIGHHPHMIQPIEWIDNANGSRTLCIYSLGNLVSAMQYSANMVGGFFTFDILVENGGKPFVSNVKYLPTVFYYAINYYSTHLYLMEDYTQELAASHGTRRYGSGSAYTYTYDDLKALVKKTISAEYLPDYLQ